MPIKGLTDRGVAFPQIGNIRKGAKKTENRPGADLPYFRVEIDERETKATARFNQLYPDGKPVAITVLLPFDDIERVWNPWREAYSAGALLHRCDGEYINYAINPDTGEVLVKNGLDVNGQPVKCNLKDNPDKRKRCKPTGRLHVIIPELERLAYLVVHTTSIWDIAHISEQLAGAKEINGRHIAGIPFILRRKWYQISTPDDKNNGKRIRRPKCLIDIEPDPEWVARKIGALKSAAMPPAQQIAAPLESSGPSLESLKDYDEPDEDDDAETVIDGEFVEPGTEAPRKTVQAPEAPAPEQHNAPAKKCSIKTPLFASRLIPALAEKTKYYNDGKDAPQPYHVLGSAAKCGYAEITADNVEAVLNDLVQHAIEQTLELP